MGIVDSSDVVLQNEAVSQHLTSWEPATLPGTLGRPSTNPVGVHQIAQPPIHPRLHRCIDKGFKTIMSKKVDGPSQPSPRTQNSPLAKFLCNTICNTPSQKPNKMKLRVFNHTERPWTAGPRSPCLTSTCSFHHLFLNFQISDLASSCDSLHMYHLIASRQHSS